MSPRVDTDVLVIGAGPTGMVAALALAKRGIRSIVVDRRTELTMHPKAHELSSRSLEILTSLDVPFESIAAEASPYDDSTKVVFGLTLKDELGRIDLREDGEDAKYALATRTPRPFLNLSQTELERVLEAAVRENPRIELRLGVRWESMREGPSTITSIVREDEGERVIVARYLLAADGASSRCRRALDIAMVGPDSIQEFVNAYVEHDLSAHVATPAKLYFMFDPMCPGTFVAHHVEKRWVYHAALFRPEDKLEDFDAAEMERRISVALGRRLPGLRVRSIELWRMTAQVAERFREGRAFLIGDAAHRFPPTGGLGMNSGIADADNLAWKLAMVLRGDAHDSLLDSYEAERRPVIERNCEESVRNYERVFDVVSALGLSRPAFESVSRMRGRMLRVLPKALVALFMMLVAFLARARIRFTLATQRGRDEVARAIRKQRPHFDRIGLDLGATYDAGALVAEDDRPRRASEPQHYVESTRPGSRLPHFWLDAARSTSSHSLIDPTRLTLLVGPSGGRWTDALARLPRLAASVRVTRIDPSEFPQLDIRASGAIVVRPDGYVAFRATELTIDYPRRIRRLARAFGLGRSEDMTAESEAALEGSVACR